MPRLQRQKFSVGAAFNIFQLIEFSPIDCIQCAALVHKRVKERTSGHFVNKASTSTSSCHVLFRSNRPGHAQRASSSAADWRWRGQSRWNGCQRLDGFMDGRHHQDGDIIDLWATSGAELSEQSEEANEAHENEWAAFIPARLRAALAWHENNTTGHAGKVQYATRASPKYDGVA
ncbi:hypothetical protein Y032_0002g1072 [Ancylostoma ceylanicum]|uniref:Uncharacterized protein n=1 Tax=Ancylostoma ceylanicum TaxID=53326 RepID=A0A016VZI2_9BILA|nr:hypothetical protein Y032_0002g1072 [Ancylostoma ceylanicum]